MTTEVFRTANSHTLVSFKSDWLVVDIGSGHNPHPRADVLADKFLFDDRERSGQRIVVNANKLFVVADACAMPFKDKCFDFAICSHVAEHIENVNDFMHELNRIAKRGYLETPSKFAERLRHAPNHRWYVSLRRGDLVFEPTPVGYPLGWFGRFFFSIYFYKTIQVEGRDVYAFAHGVRAPIGFFLRAVRLVLVRTWLLLKPFTYTRVLWEESLHWRVENTEYHNTGASR